MTPPLAVPLGAHAPSSLVAFGAGGEQTAAQLLADVTNVAAALPEPKAPDARVLMVFRSDRYAFAAGLFGAWARGYAVTLPPNQRGETVAQLLREGSVQALLHDTRVGGHIAVPELLGTPAKHALTQLILPSGVAAHSLTSGSSGASEVWPKTSAQLFGEVAVLASTFPLLRDSRFVVTVPPTHLYGLLFGVLLPLCTGAAFCRETPLHPEAVAARVREFDAKVLVSVPIHLKAAEIIEPGALTSLTRVFSSTAPLHEATAAAFAQKHKLAITEIFGSTETGGIASRQRAHDSRWRPLNGVHINSNDAGRLMVTSPFAATGTQNGFVTADRVELHADGTFTHQGRDDGIVKVGGLRVSLPALEDWLMQYPGVEDCVVVAVPELARGARILCALVAKNVAETAVREAMGSRFEPSTLPKRFLFVDRLPREANGKLQRSRVLRLFGYGADGKPLARALELGPLASRDEDGTQVSASVRVPEDYIWYAGHFETHPVMAGIVQLQELVLPLVQRHRPDFGEIRALQRVKFLGRIAPGDTIEVELNFDRLALECDFSIRKGTRSCSTGRVAFFAAQNLPKTISAPPSSSDR